MNVFDLVATMKLDAEGFYSALEQAGKAILAFTKEAVETGAAFDQAMSKVEAISGATYDEMETLRKKALQSSGQTKFTAEETADALVYMGMAGWEAAEMIDGLDAVMNLAAASGADVGRVSDIVTDALTAFRLEASDAGHFADVIATAAANANTNVQMMGESFKYAAPLAGALGFSIEDVSLALGIMANSGIKSGRAGRTLNNMFTRLADPSDKLFTILEEIGITLSDAEGHSYTFLELMQNLRGAFGEVSATGVDASAFSDELDKEFTSIAKGLGKEEAFVRMLNQIHDGSLSAIDAYSEFVDILGEGNVSDEVTERYFKLANVNISNGFEKLIKYANTLGGKQALPGLLALLTATEEDFNKLAKAIYNSNGAADEMAKTMLDNLPGDITILRSNLDLLRVSLSDRLAPTLRAVTQSFTTSIQRIREAYEKNGLNFALLTMIQEAESFAQNFQVAILPAIRDVGNALIDTFTIMAHDPKIRGPIDEAISTVFGFVERFLGDNSDVIVEFSALGFRAILPVIRGYMRGVVDVIREELPNIIAAIKEELPAFILALKELLVDVYDLLGIKDSPLGGFVSGWFEQMRGEVEGHKQLSAAVDQAIRYAESFVGGGTGAGARAQDIENLANNLRTLGIVFNQNDAEGFFAVADELEKFITLGKNNRNDTIEIVNNENASKAVEYVEELLSILRELNGYQASVNVSVTTTETTRNSNPVLDMIGGLFGGIFHSRSMFGGTILRGSTLFGYDTYGRPQYGGGEGAEAVVGVNSLSQMIASSVRGAFSGVSIQDSQPVTIQIVLDSGEVVSMVETEIARNVQWKAGGRA